MAELISDDFLEVKVDEGQSVDLEFTVKNNSQIAWPFKPLVQDERNPEIKQQVKTLLNPGEQTVCKYVYRAPLYQDVRGKKISMLLQLVDPYRYERICESTVAVRISVNEPGDELDFEQSIIQQDRHTVYHDGTDARMSLQS